MIFWTVDTRELDALCRAFSPESRTRLHHAAARSVSVLCRRHLRTIGQSRHATANRLGAAPTGHFEQAGITLTAAPDDAHVRLTLPGLARAKGARILADDEAGRLTPMYLLCASVTQKRDHTKASIQAQFPYPRTKGRS